MGAVSWGGGKNMARPVRDTVDYYPHFCDHGKTLFIIEQHYGNEGYAFWFKLLELLGKNEGHYYDCKNTDDWEFLQAKTRFLGVKCEEILDKLALLGAIDKELWENDRIIWSDNFIRNIADAYKNRKRPIPQKPISRSKTAVSTPENPQSRVEENIVDKSITNQNKEKESNACAREDDHPVDNSKKYDGGLVPTPDQAYNEVIRKGGNTTKAPEWTHAIVAWAAQKWGTGDLARAPAKDAAYLREQYFAEYNRLCKTLNLHYE